MDSLTLDAIVSTPTTPYPQDSLTGFPSQPPAPRAIDPDDPPWGVLTAAFAWAASIAVLLGVPVLASVVFLVVRYAVSHGAPLTRQVVEDPQLILASIVAIIPAHLLTVALVWVLVTGFGRRPFWPTLGWGFTRNFGFAASAGLAVLLLMLGGVISYYLGGTETDVDQIINSSTAARFTTAFLAVATAPVAEELIYRGVLYPALQRALGVGWAVAAVSALFAGVHAWQYRNNFGAILTISILSLSLTTVRARTGRLLPCVVMHTVFNGIQSVLLVYQYFRPEPAGGAKTGLLLALLAPLARTLTP